MNLLSSWIGRKLLAFAERRPLIFLLVVLAYILSPIDLLPESVMGPLGAFDDILAAIAAIAVVKRIRRRRS